MGVDKLFSGNSEQIQKFGTLIDIKHLGHFMALKSAYIQANYIKHLRKNEMFLGSHTFFCDFQCKGQLAKKWSSSTYFFWK